MLISALDTKQHEELIVDRDDLCIQVETGNPFLSNQDYTFPTEVDQQVARQDFYLVTSALEPSREAEYFIKQSLEFSKNRANRIPNSPHIMNAIALNYLRIGNIEKAAELFKNTLALDKDYFPALANLARCYSVKGDIDNALEIYQGLEKKRPNDTRVLMNIAIQFFQRKNFEEALRYLKKVLDIQPDHPFALNNTGLIYLSQKKIDQAISMLRKALRVRGDDPGINNNIGVCFAVQKNYRKAIRHFMIAHSLNKDVKHIIHNLSQAYQQVGAHEKVINLLDDYLKSHPREAELRNVIAWSYFKLGLMVKCLKELRTALKEAQPEDKQAAAGLLNNIGVAHLYLNNTKEAEQCFIDSLETYDRDDSIAFFNLIDLYFKSNDLRKAKTTIDKGLLIHQDDPLLLTFLGDCYRKKCDYTKAKNIYEKVLAINPSILGPYIALSTIEIDVNGKTESALALLERGFKRYPNSIPLINNYAYGLIMEGKLTQARRILDKVKKEDNVCLNATRGLLLIREGDIQEGRRYYNKAIYLAASKGDKNLAFLADQKKHLEIGRHFVEKGEIERAMKLLRKGLLFKTREQYYKRNIEKLVNSIKGID